MLGHAVENDDSESRTNPQELMNRARGRGEERWWDVKTATKYCNQPLLS